MSTAPANTHQGNARSAKGSRGNARSSASDEANKIKTLKELFRDWTEDDLLSVFREADSDLDKTIDYITE
ncbi:hypothetical protein IWW52_003810, partial [Coemansia sp. RSA 2704]